MQVSFRFMQIVQRGLLRSQRTVLQVDGDGQFHVVREVADGSLSEGRRLLLTPFWLQISSLPRFLGPGKANANAPFLRNLGGIWSAAGRH